MDANIPVYKDIISLAPWFGFGASFDFNARTADNRDGFDFFTGANNIEVGIGLPIKINDMITRLRIWRLQLSMGGTSVGTEPSTFWGGAKVTLLVLIHSVQTTGVQTPFRFGGGGLFLSS